MGLAFLVAWMAFAGWQVALIHRKEAILAERGIVATGTVVARESGDSDDYLHVRLDACGCVVVVGTSDLEAHPVGSTLPVRYDPKRPRRADALVDRPYPYEAPLITVAGLGLVAVILAGCVVSQRRRNRQARRLLSTTSSTARVRLELWQRRLAGSSFTYASVYRLGAGPGTTPVLTFRVEPKNLGSIPPDPVLDLYGDGLPGHPVALRYNETDVIPSGKTRSGQWEASKRNPHDPAVIVAHDDSRDEPAIVPRIDGTLLRDRREALAWQRNWQTEVRLLPLIESLFLVKVVHGRFAGLAWATAGLVVAALLGLRWSRRQLLDRLAERLPGPTSFGRRAGSDRRAIVEAYLLGPDGLAEIAARLGTTPEALAAQRRRLGCQTTWVFVLLTLALVGWGLVWFLG